MSENTSFTLKSNYVDISQSLEKEWEKLCESYLPVIGVEQSIWRFSRKIKPDDAEQGWKIHISATILSANQIFKKVAPFLHTLDILFKAPRSLLELKRINCGLFYGFSQVGKFITVYPNTPDIALILAHELHHLTEDFSSPAVPYDLPFKQNSCVYYRYGSFHSLEIENSDGTPTSAIRDPNGSLIPDLREPGTAVPSWINNIFAQECQQYSSQPVTESPLRKTIRAYEALSQRGKGGVYRALDLSVIPARLCILKEGRKNGEIDWDGRDGYWRVRHEAEVLFSLFEAGVEVPKIYMTFQEGLDYYYLVTEFIEGQNFQEFLLGQPKKIPIAQALLYGLQIAELLDKIHTAGWVWRDCKPLNLILTNEETLRPLDFEGACLVKQLESTPWGTLGYIPPEWIKESESASRIPEDLYALGSTLHQLLSGITPNGIDTRLPIGQLRKDVPLCVRELISGLLDVDFYSRPSTYSAVNVLKEAYLVRR